MILLRTNALTCSHFMVYNSTVRHAFCAAVDKFDQVQLSYTHRKQERQAAQRPALGPA